MVIPDHDFLVVRRAEIASDPTNDGYTGRMWWRYQFAVGFDLQKWHAPVRRCRDWNYGLDMS